MARKFRFVIPQIPVHATARGVNRCLLFRSGFDKAKYLKRFALVAAEEQVEIHGYCVLVRVTDRTHPSVTVPIPQERKRAIPP